MGNNIANNTLDQLFDQISTRAQSSVDTLMQQRRQLKDLSEENQTLLASQSQLEAGRQALTQQLTDLQQQLAEQQAGSADRQEDHLRVEEENQQLKDERLQLQEANRQLLEENQCIQEENQQLKEENQRLKTESQRQQNEFQALSERLNSLQGRIKEIAQGSLLDSSEALLAMIRESMQDDEQPNEPVVDSEPEEPLPEKFSAKDILDQWCKRYPKAFSNPCMQPLKIGIHEDLSASEKLPDHWIRRVLAGYVRSPRYLRLLKAGAVRLDLNGNNAGFISEEEAQHAADQLEERRLQRLQKERAHREQEESRRLNSKLAQLVSKHT